MQGPNKLYRAMKEAPVRTTFRALMNLTLPALLSWYYSKDEEWYKNIQDSYINMNIFFNAEHFPILAAMVKEAGHDPKNTIIAFPIPHEIGMIFSTLPRAGLDEFAKGREGRLFQAIKDTIKVAIPQIARDAAEFKVAPAAVAPMLQLNENISHFGRKIVPDHYFNSWTPKLPEDQTYPWTSKFGVEVSKMHRRMLKFFNSKDKALNPIQIDYLLKQHSGGLGSMVTAMYDHSVYDRPFRNPMQLTLRFPERPGRQIELFYFEMNELKMLKFSKKASGKELARLKKMSNFKKKVMDPHTKRRMNIGDNGLPITESDIKKTKEIYKSLARKMNSFLGDKYKDLK